MLSKEDWTKGEPTRQYHAKGDARKQSARQVAQSTKGWLGKRVKWIAGGVLALILILAVV